MKSDATPRNFALFIAAAVVIALRLIALQAGDMRIWGLDVLRHLDSWWVVAFSVLPLFAALPALEHRFGRLMAKRDFPWTRVLWIGVAMLFAAAVLFPMETFYYGDGGPLLSEIYKIGAEEHYTSTMLLNLKSAPLAGGLLHLLSVLIPSVMFPLGLTLPETPLFPFFGLSLLGIVLLGWTMHLEKERRFRLPLMLLVVGTGGGLFFFRYAEMYLPLFLAITAYLLAASAALRGERSVGIAVLLYIVAVAAHYMALALLPSLLYLLLRKQPILQKLTASGRSLGLTFAGMLALAFALYFVFGFQHSDSRMIMPLLPVESPAGTLSYTLLSSYHLLDLVNLLFLLAAFPMTYLLMLSLGKGGLALGTASDLGSTLRGSKTDSGGGKTESGGARGMSEALRFQLISGYSFLLFLFFANTSLGLARDWDIAAPLGVMIVMILSEFRGKAELSPSRLLQAGVVSVLLVVPWFATNIDVEASTARFAEIMTLDDEHMYGDYALSGYEALRKQAVHEKDFDREGEILQRMIELVGYTEQYRMLISNTMYYAEKQPERYLRLNEWALGRLARKAQDLRSRGVEHEYSIGLKQIDSLAAVMAVESVTNSRIQDLYPLMKTFAERSGCVTGINILLGTGWYLEEELAKALPLLAAVRETGFRDPRVDGMYGSCLYLSGETAGGEAEFADGLQRYGENAQYLFMVATSYLRLQTHVQEARTLLERARALNPPPEAREQIEGILNQLK
ncbi:MAG: hypothetical protein IH600_04205 [Bacteroidetes bacterium]|nr:hypothetical protein [Bacteroidota bacterium]